MSHDAWIRQAESDLAAADLLNGSGKCHSQAVWLAGQAVEKAHKAILAALGFRYEEKHFKQLWHNTSEISKLLPEALHQPINPDIADKVASLESRSDTARYPRALSVGGLDLVAPAESIVESRQDVADARVLLEWCRERVARALKAARALAPENGPSPTRVE